MPLKELAERRTLLHRKSDPHAILSHALGDVQIGKLAVVSSFGAESVVLLHMVADIAPETPVLFLDTEMLFPETLKYHKRVADELALTDVRVIKPSRATLMTHDVDSLLHQADPDACCALRKTQPLETALAGFDGWITGRKSYQNGQRASLPPYERDGRRIKINPLAQWGPTELDAYMTKYVLPRHPLVARGYPSVGCAPCTTRVTPGEDPRAGRWRDTDKTECGIHFDNGTAMRKAAS
jgi:phosphoadenosine phosphosulfate reductase